MRAGEAAAEAVGDADLVRRCRDGDEDAWRTLVERHSPLVWAVATRLGVSRTDASDAFQAAWTVAVEELPRLREPERFPQWIARVARHQCMRMRRSYGIARRAHERIAREDVDHALPDEDLVALEERSRVARELARLGDRCRDLLRALYEEDPRPAYEEIAERLRMRIGSIGPTRARCLSRLREAIEEGTHDARG